jgi:hypothetical protein
MRLIVSGAPRWGVGLARDVERGLREPFDHPIRLQSFTVATLPAAADWTTGMIYVSDETGGPVPAFSDGTNWRRVTDRAIVS